jgi:hypothetical protein
MVMSRHGIGFVVARSHLGRKTRITECILGIPFKGLMDIVLGSLLGICLVQLNTNTKTNTNILPVTTLEKNS